LKRQQNRGKDNPNQYTTIQNITGNRNCYSGSVPGSKIEKKGGSDSFPTISRGIGTGTVKVSERYEISLRNSNYVP
jgi:hypothetical protein